ncbi:MAG: EF-P 5-aminopentanol modification-associated protein YfmH [Bacilli bacterium]
MKKYYHKRLNERYYIEVLENGLTLYLFPKPKYTTTIGYFITKFGSCDIEFVPSDKQEFYKAPRGVAHFLEHKLFESSDDLDPCEVFEQLGATYNAFTSLDRTVYYFSTTSKVKECIDNLLNLVQHAHFTESSVNKEKSIIMQEIHMHANNSTNEVYNCLTRNMYFSHPCQYEIGGTNESVNAITADDLYTCYNTFYHPSNMALIIVGNIDIDEIHQFVVQKEAKLNIQPQKKIIRKEYHEECKIVNKDTSSNFNVVTPKVGCGIKIDMNNVNKIQHYKDINLINRFLDYYFDETSSFYKRMEQEEILDQSFTYGFDDGEDYFYLYFIANTNKVEAFKENLIKEFKAIREDTFPVEHFIRQKKLILHANISKYNNIEYIGTTLCNMFINKMELFEGSDIKENLNIEDMRHLSSYIKEDMVTFHTLYPINKKVE